VPPGVHWTVRLVNFHLVKRKADLQAGADGGRSVVAKAGRERHREPIIEVPGAAVDLVEHRRKPIAPLRLKGKAGNDVEAMGETKNRSGVEQDIAGLTGAGLAIALLPDNGGSDLVAHPEMLAVIDIHAERKSDSGGRLKLGGRFILIDGDPGNNKAEVAFDNMIADGVGGGGGFGLSAKVTGNE
jgi:hypothetical protein